MARVTDSLLAWILEDDMLRMGRLSTEVQSLVDHEALGSRNALYLEKVLNSVRDALLLDRPEWGVEQVDFFAGAFLCMVAQPMYVEALEGRRPPGYNEGDKALVLRYIDLFINGWKGRTDFP
ncbi:hypothetical protein XB05_19035 [Xanthomonas arboricola]|nr:hypothetical protein XB05_19035 [Xanthomonas arboricola]